METILRIQKLTKQYGSKFAIKDVSFEIEKGKVYGLLGPNGSGKTTTLGIVLGIINKSSGTYSWFSEEPSHKHLKRIGALLENPNFYPYITGLENLKIVADIKEVPYSKIDEVLKLVGLYERRTDKFQTYSLGMKQRLAIASALLNDPEVLVLDEPTNGLDPQGIAEIRELITNIAKKGTSILLASHLLDEVEKVCTDVIVLKNGSIIYLGSTSNSNDSRFFIKVKSDDTESLLEVMNAFEGVTKSEINDEGEVISHLNKEIKGEELNKYLFEKGIFPSKLSIEEQSLESRFLEITKNK